MKVVVVGGGGEVGEVEEEGTNTKTMGGVWSEILSDMNVRRVSGSIDIDISGSWEVR